jgi:hypothetical protein
MIGTMTHLRFVIWLTLLIFPIVTTGQEQPEPDAVVDTIYTNVDLFGDSSAMNITLTLDLKEYQRKKHEGKYLPARFTYQINDTLRLEKEMRVKARGNFRRDYCQFAPFWLNIKKSGVENKYLKDTKKIKIVTHCGDSKSYRDLVLKEYLAYRIYNILSPVSFRVRLIDMTYVDTGRKGRITHTWAFMIEPEELVAERHQALVFKKDDLSMRLMEPEAFDLMAMFMYMIGNPDYSVAGRHNVKILGLEGFGATGYTPVPYDFDYSGLVNASYAIPGDNLGISSVRERYFLGLCREDEAYLKAIQTLNDHREEILELVREFSYLDERDRKEMILYLESYFKKSGNPQVLIRDLRSTCR